MLNHSNIAEYCPLSRPEGCLEALSHTDYTVVNSWICASDSAGFSRWHHVQYKCTYSLT